MKSSAKKRMQDEVAAVRRKLALAAFRCGINFGSLCESAHHSLVAALTQSACRYKADLYVGHCLAALPAVVKAARQNGALAGFDAEDYHSGELSDHGQGRTHNAIARRIEDRYLPYVDHFTAASPLIAKAYEKRFGKLPTTILNVFPLSEAPSTPTQGNDKDADSSFYWFSQTVGSWAWLRNDSQDRQTNEPAASVRFSRTLPSGIWTASSSACRRHASEAPDLAARQSRSDGRIIGRLHGLDLHWSKPNR